MRFNLIEIKGPPDEAERQIDALLETHEYSVSVAGQSVLVQPIELVSVQYLPKEMKTLCWYVNYGQSVEHIRLRDVFAQF